MSRSLLARKSLLPFLALLTLSVGQVTGVRSLALDLSGYSSAQNDRFSSGFPLNPVPNGNPGFVGAGLDWSGVSWSTTTHAASTHKNLALLSPRHFLTTQHYPSAGGIRILGKDGTIYTWEGSIAIDNLGYGLDVSKHSTTYDLAMGTLAARVVAPSLAERYPTLDLHPSSTTDQLSNYNGLSLLLYGRGPSTTASPRIAAASANLVAAFNNDPKQTAIRTLRSEVVLQGGDSSSPALYAWTSPDGDELLTVLGTHTAINDTYNYTSFLSSSGGMAAANQVMTPDGFVLRVVGNPSFTWEGDTSNSIAQDVAWGVGGNPNTTGATSDQYVLFDAASATSRSVAVDEDYFLRGLYFKSTGATGDEFTFSNSRVLTIGRGGISNYDNDAQVFQAPFSLDDHQFWDGGPGGLQVADIATAGHLLELRAGGGSTISGDISGSGGLAVESGTLTLAGMSSYTGRTWVHDGLLKVDGGIDSSPSVTVAETATLSGTGEVSRIQGGGLVSPGDQDGILTASDMSPGAGLDFAFAFRAASAPQFGSPGASTNDLLRLTGGSPFSTSLTGSNQIDIFLDVAGLSEGQQFKGGFFTDQAQDFLSDIGAATIDIYLADAGGAVSFEGENYSLYTGPLEFEMTTVSQSADFGDGAVDGRILQFEVLPDPATYSGWELDAFPEATPEADRLPSADPNDDGVINKLVYALDLDPLDTDLTRMPSARFESTPSGKELVFEFRQNSIADDLTYAVWISDDLETWNDSGIAPTLKDADIDGDGSAALMEVRIPLAPSTTRKFAQLRVTLSEP